MSSCYRSRARKFITPSSVNTAVEYGNPHAAAIGVQLLPSFPSLDNLDTFVHRGYLVEFFEADDLDLIELGHLLHLRRGQLRGDSVGQRVGLNLLIACDLPYTLDNRLLALLRPALKIGKSLLPILGLFGLFGQNCLVMRDRNVERLLLTNGTSSRAAVFCTHHLLIDQR